jgi:alkane 1-monooxygenase
MQGTNVADQEGLRTPKWRDAKRYLWLLSAIVPGLVPLAWLLVQLTGQDVFWWVGPAMAFMIVPVLDHLVGNAASEESERTLEWLEDDAFYRWVTYLYLPSQYLSLAFACWLWSGGGWITMTWLDKVGLMLTVGIVGGISINAAHELGHRRAAAERRLSKLALAQTAYGHFYIEHNRGHHVRVATPEDPASSRFGETFWEFLPRSVWGSARSAVKLEATRIRRLGRSPWDPRTWLGNDVLNAWLMTVVLFGALIAVFGPALIPFLVIQAVFGFSMLESVNYLEHYGLLRQKNENGRYERCTPEHSWNSDHLVTNLFLYHLQRHSDHHANPTRRYQTLRSMDGAPELPTGYATLIGVTYLPWVWRRMMDHRVLEHYNGDITKVNIDPRRREKILARYGAGAQA